MPTESSIQKRFLHYSKTAFRNVHGLEAHAPECAIWDSPELLHLARKHRMIGILYAGISTGLPAQWQNLAYGQASLSARYTNEALRLVETFSQTIIPTPLLIKGPGLAMQAWPDPALRAFDDFDFRCRIEDFKTFQDVAIAAGYIPLIQNADHNEHLWHFGWGVTFRHIDGYFLEVNHRLFPRPYPCPKRIAPQEGIMPVCEQQLDGRLAIVPTPAAHLVLASAHALWHGGERLAWIADIAGLLVRHPDILQEAVRICGKHVYLRNAVITACLLADQLFGPDLPGRERNDKERNKLIKPHILNVCAIYRQQVMASNIPTRAERRRLQRPLCSKTEACGAFVRRALTPGEPDFNTLNLKPEQRNRYWFYRPLRILRRRIQTKL